MLRLLLAALLPAWALAADRVVFTADFDDLADGASIEQAGWRIRDPNRDCRFEVVGKALQITCSTAKDLRGGGAEIDLPLVRRGRLEFDLLNDHDRKGIGLCLDVFNISVFWHEYCGDWRRYFPEPVSRRIPAFDLEPVGHRRLSAVAKRAWNHYRIVFDKDRDRVEYYCNNLVDPVFIDGGVAVWGRSEYLGGVLRLGNWGVVPDHFTYRIDNIRLTAQEPDAAGQEVPRDRIVLFSGLSSERYAVKEALLANGVAATRIQEYTLHTQGAALEEKNKLIADRMPGLQTTSRAAAIVLTDFPCAPDAVLPDCVLEDLADNVRQGARLIILGGLLSYAKGGYASSPLARIIPVQMATCWDVQACVPALRIEPAPAGAFASLAWQAAPLVAYRHALEPVADARVLLSAGGRPLLVARSHGKGEVLAFLGTACGAPPGVAFWRWSDWPRLAVQMILGGDQAPGPATPGK